MMEYVQLELLDFLTQNVRDKVETVSSSSDYFASKLSGAKHEAITTTLETVLLSNDGRKFASACEILLKNFWRETRNYRQSFYLLFKQLSNKRHIDKAMLVLRSGVKDYAVAAFYEAANQAKSNPESHPVIEINVAQLDALVEATINRLKSPSPVNLQARFDELFTQRPTIAETIYLRMILEGENPQQRYQELAAIAVGIDEFSGLKPTKASALSRAWATFNHEHGLAKVYIKGAMERWK